PPEPLPSHPCPSRVGARGPAGTTGVPVWLPSCPVRPFSSRTNRGDALLDGWSDSLPSLPPQPEAAPGVLQAQLKVAFEHVAEATGDEIVEQNDLVGEVEGQECSQEVGLVPGPTLLRPGHGVLKG